MPDAAEVAIEYALLSRAKDFADGEGVTIALPNMNADIPSLTPTAKWLRANVMPAEPDTLGLSDDSINQHIGLMQVDVFYGAQSAQGAGGGFAAPARLASSVIAYFARGTEFSRDGFTVRIPRTPSRGQLLKDDDGWHMIPVRIPWRAFARRTE